MQILGVSPLKYLFNIIQNVQIFGASPLEYLFNNTECANFGGKPLRMLAVILVSDLKKLKQKKHLFSLVSL